MKQVIPYIALTVSLIVSPCDGDESGFEFPELHGWTKQEHPDYYTEQTLYDYINGAADLYLRYDFKELHVMNYENPHGLFLTIDLYTHGDDVNAFGIYSRERLPASDRIPVGVEGYSEQGILNFVKSRFYVKISCYGTEGDSIPEEVAQRVSETMDGSSELPRLFSLFPDSNRIRGSETYIADDYLGHSFLQSVYAVDYSISEEPATLFLVDGADSAGGRHVMESYYSLAGVERAFENTRAPIAITDPFHRSDGPVTLRWDGRYVWGIYSEDASAAQELLSTAGGIAE